MADLVENLYRPLERYHLANGSNTVVAAASATADATKLGAQISMNGNVDKFLDKVTANQKGAPSAATSQLTDAIIAKWKRDPEFIKKLDKDLANPQTAKKLEDAVKANPAGVAKALPQYTSGNLDQILPAAAARPAAPAATTPQAATTTTAPSTPKAAASTPAARPAPATSSAQSSPIAAVAASTAPNPNAPAAPSQSDMTKSILREIASGSDEEIKNAVTPKFVERLGNGLADFGEEKFSQEDLGSKGFRDKIKSDPALQRKIADNLRDNPELIRGLANAMDDKEAGKGAAGSAVKSKLKQIYANPNLLADPDYTRELSSQMDMAKGGMNGMISKMFGNDASAGIGGFMGNLQNMFKGLTKWFGNIMESFSSGNFALMSNMDPKMGMWDKFSMSLQRAKNTDGLEANASVLKRDGANGPVNGDGKVVDAQGKPVMENVYDPQDKTKVIGQRQATDPSFDHRVEFGGHKFYLTNGLQPSPVMKNGQPFGQNHWYVATKVDANGRAVDVQEVVLNDADSAALMKRMETAAKANGTTVSFDTPVVKKADIETQRHDQKTGRPIGEAYKPEDAPANDADVKIYKLPEPEKIKATPIEPSVVPAV